MARQYEIYKLPQLHRLRQLRELLDYRENERFYDKNPSIEGTDIRARILIEISP